MRFIALLLSAWVAFSVQAEEIKLNHQNITLNARLEQAAGKSLQEGVVLILHGTLAHNGMEIIAGLQERLKAKGFNTLAINLSLGVDDRHGMYDCSVTNRHKHTDALAELAAWTRWLEGKGVNKIDLIGHSRGGNQIAWFAAEHAPKSLGKVVLVAPQTWSAQQHVAGYQKRYGKSLPELLARVRQADADALLGSVDFVYCANSRVLASSFIDYYRDEPRFDTPSLIPAIKTPVMVIAAASDEIVPGLIEKTQPLANAGKAKLLILEGADHFFRDLYSDDLADAIDAFLK
jgi:pimeloyl-ACP methyl ester carboxylesterase